MINTFPIDIIPKDEEKRLNAVYNYTLLDTLPDAYFTNLTQIIASVFKAPITLISIVEKESVFFKGNVGLEGILKVDRGSSLCALAILNHDVTVFNDALTEPCLLTNPLVRGKFGLRFYAGAPLITHDGYAIGTVCIVDKEPRAFSKQQELLLKRFSWVVMHEIEMRMISATINN